VTSLQSYISSEPSLFVGLDCLFHLQEGLRKPIDIVGEVKGSKKNKNMGRYQLNWSWNGAKIFQGL